MGLHGLSKKLGKVENLLGVDLNGDGKIGDKPGKPPANNAPAQGGYPGAAGQGGYQQPQQPGAPQGGYPGANAGAPHGGGYPGANAGGYPAPQGGALPGAPNQGGAFPGAPPQGGAFPGAPNQPGYPGQGGAPGYPQAQAGMPGVPPQQGGYPGLTPQGSGFPGQGGAPGYPAPGAGAPGGYPGQPDGDKGMGKVAAGAALAYGVHHHHQGQQQQQQQQQQNNNHHAAAAAGAGLAAGGLAYGMHHHNQGQQNNNHGGLAFFNHANNHEQRNYVLIIDRSGSMGGRRWKEAQEAVQTLAPFICKFDPDGICLFLFETNFKKFNNIKTPDQVARIFSEHRPSGGTYLHKVLDAAFDDHFREFQRSRRGTTILVVTDGAPSVASAVETSIRNATHKMGSDPELSVSFIQIGDDSGATRFLKGLDDSLRGAKFDIVDTMKDEHASSMSFAQLINLSIHD